MTRYYVVWIGREPGVYHTWPECQRQVDGFTNAKFKKFTSLKEAQDAFFGEIKQKRFIRRSHQPNIIKPYQKSDLIKEMEVSLNNLIEKVRADVSKNSKTL